MAIKKSEDLYNDKIPFLEVNVITEEGKNLGIMRINEALYKAQEVGLDLVCIAPNATIPICKILNYDHYRYQKNQKEKEARKLQRASIIEEHQIRLTVGIGENDLKTKARIARKFLVKGDKIKVSLKYKGREHQHKEYGHETFEKFYKQLTDVSMIDESSKKLEGNFLNAYLLPISKKNVKENSNKDDKKHKNVKDSNNQ